jgi:hypothetical protein
MLRELQPQGWSSSKRTLRPRYTTLAITTWAQRLASIGISLRHSGHFLVVGAGAGWSLTIRASNQFTGTTTKKYTAAAINKKR